MPTSYLCTQSVVPMGNCKKTIRAFCCNVYKLILSLIYTGTDIPSWKLFRINQFNFAKNKPISSLSILRIF